MDNGYLWENQRERDHWEYQDIDGWITLRRIFTIN
jgi:hypothetical protein